MMTNDDLIQLVYSKREIWDQNALHYHSKEMKAKAWAQIAEELNVSADAAKSRWTNLRDLFRRELKKMLKMARDTGDPDSYLPRWKHFRSMLFLKDQIVKDEDFPSLVFEGDDLCSFYPQTILDDGEAIQEEESCEDEHSSNNSTPNLYMELVPSKSGNRRKTKDHNNNCNRHKRSKKQRKEILENMDLTEDYPQIHSEEYSEIDGDYHFVMSILPSIKRIRQDRKTSFKMKVMQLIMEEENSTIRS